MCAMDYDVEQNTWHPMHSSWTLFYLLRQQWHQQNTGSFPQVRTCSSAMMRNMEQRGHRRNAICNQRFVIFQHLSGINQCLRSPTHHHIIGQPFLLSKTYRLKITSESSAMVAWCWISLLDWQGEKREYVVPQRQATTAAKVKL